MALKGDGSQDDKKIEELLTADWLVEMANNVLQLMYTWVEPQEMLTRERGNKSEMDSLTIKYRNLYSVLRLPTGNCAHQASSYASG